MGAPAGVQIFERHLPKRISPFEVFMRVLSIAAVTALSTIAFAQMAVATDLPVKAPINTAVAIDPWAGTYVGLNVGYSWGDWDASSNQRVFNFEITTANPKVDGWLGGLQAGYNWRLAPQWILGVEGDIQISGEKDSQNWVDPGLPAITPPPPPPPPEELLDFVPRPGGPAALSHQWKFPWFGTLRLRAGMTPSSNWLLYVTGGLAVGETKYTFNFSQPGAAGNTPPTATTYSLSHNSTKAGFTVGGGTEVKLDRNWSVKLEYLYIDLGTESIQTSDIDGAPFQVQYHVRDNIVRGGLNYSFEGP